MEERKPVQKISISPLNSLYLQTLNGAIAQLARALAWHARGPGFKSP